MFEAGDGLDAVVFHDAIAHAWSEKYEKRSFKKRLDLFVKIISSVSVPEQKWLDLGCGTGVLSAELLHLRCYVDAVDGSKEMIKSAQTFLSELDEKVRFKISDVRDLSWSPSFAYDGVLCSSVIEYLENPEVMMNEVNRVLKPGGILIISMPPKNSFIRVIQKRIKWTAACIGFRIYDYMDSSKFEIDPKSADKWFTKFGFQVTGRTYYDPMMPWLFLSVLRPSLFIYKLKKLSS